ncbi:serine hydrolase domain-containing protein [Lacticaseibacillus brantae]|nr:serine hydrolase domain-containing protein [Lacticaseibacillus brantae]
MQVKKLMAALLADRIVPGISYAWLSGQSVYEEVLGEAQWLPQPAPLRPGMLYDIASLTKVLGTLTVFLQQVDVGSVAVDDEIRQYLPGFDAPTTFRQALTHTSGLEGYIPHRDQLSAPDLRQALLTQLHPTTAANHQVVYRDVNLLLVGWALERIVGSPIQTLITDQVLRPLGLPTATFTPQPDHSVPTTFSQERGLLKGRVHDPKSAILGVHSGAAGLFASLNDLIIFTQYIFGQRQNSVWPSFYRQSPTDATAGLGRALGWDLRGDAHNRNWFYHTGYTGTFWLIQPQTQQALIVLTNRVHPTVNADFLPRRDEIVKTVLENAH